MGDHGHGHNEQEKKTLLNQMFDDSIGGGAITWTIGALAVIFLVMIGLI